MEKEDITQILGKIGKEQLTEAEEAKAKLWLFHLHGDEPSGLSQQQVKMAGSDNWNRLQTQHVRPRSRRLWPRWIAAASIAMAVFAGGYFYYKAEIAKNDTELAAVKDLAPGKDGATLTLANGKKIYINDALAGNIATQSGVKISKTADGEIIYEVIPDNSKILTYNTLTTTRGEQTRVRLPDGTLVFLNAESSLKYPTTFAGSAKRAVFLSGEGYFEVSKDNAHPFEVSTTDQIVQVLGTHFNINAYSNSDATRTTLLEGSVRVENLDSKKAQILSPGQQSKVSGDALELGAADIDEAVAWKEGAFIYNSVPLEKIMADISRWYAVDVEFADAGLKRKMIYITANRYDKVSEFLKPLGRIAKVDFEIRGDKIIVNRKKN